MINKDKLQLKISCFGERGIVSCSPALVLSRSEGCQMSHMSSIDLDSVMGVVGVVIGYRRMTEPKFDLTLYNIKNFLEDNKEN